MFVAFHNQPPLITMFFFSIFFQGAEVSSDEGLDKRDINVYRSQVKITGYNSHGHNSQVKCLKTDTIVFLFPLRRNKVLFLRIKPKKKTVRTLSQKLTLKMHDQFKAEWGCKSQDRKLISNTSFRFHHGIFIKLWSWTFGHVIYIVTSRYGRSRIAPNQCPCSMLERDNIFRWPPWVFS